MTTALKVQTLKVLITCLIILIAFAAVATPAAAQGDTFLIYYAIGVDLEEKLSSSSENMIDLVNSWNPESGNFLAFYGSANKPGWNEGTAVADYANLKKDVETDGIIGSDNGVPTESVLTKLPSRTGSKAGLVDAIQYANKYADENGLGNAHRYIILSDHGAGYNGLGPTAGNSGENDISNAEIAEGLALSSKKFDIIMYDACTMANLEAAYLVKSSGDYLLASEEVEPSTGYSYSAVSQAFAPSASKDPKAVGNVIIDGYLAEESDSAKTLSLIDLSKIDTVVYNLDKVGDSLKNVISDTDTLNAIGYIYRSSEFGENDPFIDVYDFAQRLSQMGQNEIRDNAASLANSVNDAVAISKKTGFDNDHGLQFANAAQFTPSTIDEKITLSNGGWSQFLYSYTSVLSGENNAQYSYSTDSSSEESSSSDDDTSKSVKSVSTGTLTVSNDNGQTVVFVDHLYLSGDKYYIVGQVEAQQGIRPTSGNSNWAYLPTNEYKTGDDWECNAFVLKNAETTVPLSLLDPEEYTESDGKTATSYVIYGDMTRVVNGKVVTYPSYLTACVDVKSGKVYDLYLNSNTDSNNLRRLNLWGSEDIFKGDKFTPKLDYLSDKSDEVLSEMSSASFVFSDNPLDDLQLVDLDADKCFWDYEISSISDTPLDQPQHLNQLDFINGPVSANQSHTTSSAATSATANPTASAKSCVPFFAVPVGLATAGVLCRRRL